MIFTYLFIDKYIWAQKNCINVVLQLKTIIMKNTRLNTDFCRYVTIHFIYIVDNVCSNIYNK